MPDEQTTKRSSPNALPDEQRRGVYEAIYGRRDIRSFRPDPIPDDVLARILDAAHHAGSVGFMQPWDFLVIKSAETRTAVRALFERERQAAACFYDEPRRSDYLALKLEGIAETPLNLCVTCDPTRGGEVLGRNSVPETDVYSTCCAVQNLWLAARAEGVGVGWVSILKMARLHAILGIPPHVIPVAYLCLGYVDAFPARPTLATASWRQRLTLGEVVAYESWGRRDEPTWQGLSQALAPSQGEAPPARRGLGRLLDTIAAIGPLDEAALVGARARQDTLTKPPGSLGRLEEVAIRLAGITGQARPILNRKAIIVMAGDHGVVAEGVSAYPAAVTPQMVANFLHGGAAINVLARAANARVVVVDVGVATPVEGAGLVARKVAPGTRNMSEGPALTRAETLQAIEVGFDVLDEQFTVGLDVVALGEMGIGNTTAASVITAALTGLPPAAVTGRGTGVDDACDGSLSILACSAEESWRPICPTSPLQWQVRGANSDFPIALLDLRQGRIHAAVAWVSLSADQEPRCGAAGPRHAPLGEADGDAPGGDRGGPGAHQGAGARRERAVAPASCSSCTTASRARP
jgi:nicotinate-nucleotide--dimethylbenzimidazole phosphoribosyltransferase